MYVSLLLLFSLLFDKYLFHESVNSFCKHVLHNKPVHKHEEQLSLLFKYEKQYLQCFSELNLDSVDVLFDSILILFVSLDELLSSVSTDLDSIL